MNKKVIIFLITIIPFLSFSQEILSLENAIKIGLNKNFDIQLSRKNKEITQLNNNLGNSGALPTINISSKKEDAVSDQSNNPTSFIQEILSSESINASANMSWTLLSGYRIQATKEKLRQLEFLSNGNLTLIIENTTQAIILSYYNCILQKERLKLLQNVVNLSRERLIYQKTKYDIGVSSKMDVLQIETSLLTDSSNLLIQRLNYNNSVKTLNLVLGLDLNSEWNLTDKMSSKTQLFKFEELQSEMFKNNTTMINQCINNEIIRQDIKLAKSVYYPIVSFNSGASYNESTYDIGDSGFEGNNTGETLNYYANISVNFRLYDGGKYRILLQEAEIKNEINDLRLEKLQEETKNQLSINYEKYNSRIIIFNLSKKAFNIAEINYQLANEKNNRGIINSFNLRDIEIAYLNSGISYLQATYNLNESYLELVKITGGILEDNSIE